MDATSCDTLISLIYVSSAVDLFSQADLLTLLETSRRNNALAGITGMLLYRDGNFMQAIEGEAEEIQRLHERISHDPRHTGLITLLQQPIKQRQFADWSMGFKNLSDTDLREVVGYNEFLITPLTGEAFALQPSRAEKLLQAFKYKM